MIALRWTLGAIVAASAASASTNELQLFSRLLKRQEPGTPEYNCHDNCGKHALPRTIHPRQQYPTHT